MMSVLYWYLTCAVNWDSQLEMKCVQCNAGRATGGCSFRADAEALRHLLLLAMGAPCNRLLFLQKIIRFEVRLGLFWEVLGKEWGSSQYGALVCDRSQRCITKRFPLRQEGADLLPTVTSCRHVPFPGSVQR